MYIFQLWRLCAWCMITLLMNYYAIFRLILWKNIIVGDLRQTVGDKVLRQWCAAHHHGEAFDLAVMKSSSLLDQWWWALYHHRINYRANSDEELITAGAYVGPTMMKSSTASDHTSDRQITVSFELVVIALIITVHFRQRRRKPVVKGMQNRWWWVLWSSIMSQFSMPCCIEEKKNLRLSCIR